ncbi:hypothetical protein FBU59_000344 [Linderina macrospora]|uniref:Uncharacterized protein n=1 Tax=Linderina macrospora TaxID=4868 RepID=A0ACC1JHB6_9FUNG|nr:hypothetical protein FBU59_000344 [Linderina macrospora]
MSDSAKRIEIVIAGGNYAGFNALHHLYTVLLAAPSPANVHITLVDRRDGFVHFIGITRGLTEPEFGEKLWVPYSETPWISHPQITVKQATVSQITATAVHLADGSTLSFDYLIIALGQSRFAPIGVASTTHQEFVAELAEAHENIKKADNVVVVGGGAVGIEMAADVKADFPSKQVSLVHSRALPIPGPFKDEFRKEVVRILEEDIGVNVVLGDRTLNQLPQSTQPGMAETTSTAFVNTPVQLTSGKTLPADWAIFCLGTQSKLPLISLDASVITPNGIAVKPTLQVDHEELGHIFAVGDICARDEVKLAGVAMYGAYIAAHNISRSVLGVGKYEESEPNPSKLLLLMGKDHWAFQMGDEIWDKERTRQYVHDDMGLEVCVAGLSLRATPAHTPLET